MREEAAAAAAEVEAAAGVGAAGAGAAALEEAEEAAAEELAAGGTAPRDGGHRAPMCSHTSVSNQSHPPEDRRSGGPRCEHECECANKISKCMFTK
jgi:hypothetical protein